MATDPTNPPTELLTIDRTLDQPRRGLGSLEATEELSLSDGRRAGVALVAGGTSAAACELDSLLRRRLRLAALTLLAGFAAFLIQSLFLVDVHKPAELVVLGLHLLVTLVLGVVGGLLCRRCEVPLGNLRVCELAVFGLPAAFLPVAQTVVALDYAARGQVALNAGPWLLLIFSYALFIPNPLRRAATMIGGMAAMPLVMVVAMKWGSVTLGPLIGWDHLTSIFLMVLCAAAGSIFGVDTIGTLRREAQEARQFGQYHLKQRLGAGGMGEVYLAEHHMLKRPCVVKLIRPSKADDPRMVARFHREVRATAKLSHWNTVEIYDYGSAEDGTFYYVMEYLPGKSLAALVEQHGPLPPERVVHILRQACDALREAHAAGLIHRDIKPGNIYAAYLGGVFDVVKLLDFGLVKPLTDDEGVDLTTEGSITGSPLFMSPEQAMGEGTADPRSDIYSLGAVGYYLLTGQPPFPGEKMMKVLIAHIHQPPRPPSEHRADVPVDLEQVILRCLAKDPDDRFADAAALYEALSRCCSAGQWTRQRAAEWWANAGAAEALK